MRDLRGSRFLLERSLCGHCVAVLKDEILGGRLQKSAGATKTDEVPRKV
ncbi:hypothetical protein [Rubritalea tangerina]